ncbi:MAG TPA: tRNA (cytidine(34)-2'-O)-methyltransferase [Candidatus Binataceae bacterium]|nr:tRNA (cytidine(34)-2'-O)-methyltransferase [Candidatus Binataceae bacterium]
MTIRINKAASPFLAQGEGVRSPHLNVVLVRPEIPQNTGSIARLTAAARVRLHLVGPLGYSLEDRYLKRAGLDYWPLVDLCTYADWEAFAAAHPNVAMKYFSARTDRSYLSAKYQPGDFLVFGSETKGLGRDFIAAHRDDTFNIPIFEAGVRSLNLSNAVSIVVYEALRQTGAIR